MSVAIAESACRVEERGEDDGVAVEDPRHRTEIGVTEGRADLGERDVDDEQVQAGQEGRRGHHDDRRLGRVAAITDVATLTCLANRSDAEY